MCSDNNEPVVFILTHARARSVLTINALRRCGYSGDILLVIDDEDPQKELYFDSYKNRKGVEVVVFSKKDAALYTDVFDNLPHRGGVVYARNAVFRIAAQRGIVYFIVLDDDYTDFSYRFSSDLRFLPAGSDASRVKSLDVLFKKMLDFYKSAPHLSVLSIAQTGDFVGGGEAQTATRWALKRKAMNFFLCSTERPVSFSGRLNEDTTLYTAEQNRGVLCLTLPLLVLKQKTTQKQAGGLTELYLEHGTYTKSFYTILPQPSSVSVSLLKQKHARMHHKISWTYTVPQLVSPVFRKLQE